MLYRRISGAVIVLASTRKSTNYQHSGEAFSPCRKLAKFFPVRIAGWCNSAPGIHVAAAASGLWMTA
jgi:hypothetical protein